MILDVLAIDFLQCSYFLVLHRIFCVFLSFQSVFIAIVHVTLPGERNNFSFTFFSPMLACSIPTKTNTRSNMTVNYIFSFIFRFFKYFYHMIKIIIIIIIISFHTHLKQALRFHSNALLAWSSKRECLFPLETEVTFFNFYSLFAVMNQVRISLHYKYHIPST